MTRQALLLALVLILAGCASGPRKDPPAARPALSGGKYYLDDGPGENPPDLAHIPDAVPRDEPLHRYANRPYQVFGRTYVPNVAADGWRERGVASWYGRKFHGQKTASGEVYDMYAMSAAHKTLPIPSYVRVSHGGKSVVVRVNDRGPFHGDRVIDLSYAAAARLGLAQAGSGVVEIERVFASGRVASAPPSLSAVPSGVPREVTPDVSQEAGGFFVQLGAFATEDNALAFSQRMSAGLAGIGTPHIQQREGLARVRLGPYATRNQAASIAARVQTALGISAHVSR
jgi:rare lipoprotein A